MQQHLYLCARGLDLRMVTRDTGLLKRTQSISSISPSNGTVCVGRESSNKTYCTHQLRNRNIRMLKRQTKVVSTVFVVDKRWTGEEAAEIHLVHEGSVMFREQEVDVAIVHHVAFRCFELVIFVPKSAAAEVWARFYFSRDVLISKLKPNTLSGLLNDTTDNNSRRRHPRHHKSRMPVRVAQHRYDGMASVIVEMIPELLKYDAVQRLVEGDNKDVTHDIMQENSSSLGFNYDTIAMLLPKPEFLVPVNVDITTVDQSYEDFLVSDRRHKLVSLGVKRISHTLASRVQPLFTIAVRRAGPSSNISAAKEVLPSTNPSPSAYSRLRTSLRRLSALFQPSSVVPYEDSDITADTSDFSHLKPDAANGSPIRPSVVRRLSSIFTKRGSFLMAIATGDSASLVNSDDYAPSLTYVSCARFRWIMSIDKVIRRNMTQRLRHLLQRRAVMIQLRRVILRQRSDFALLIRQDMVEERLPILQLPASQFAHKGFTPLAQSKKSGSGRGMSFYTSKSARMTQDMWSDVVKSRWRHLTIDTTTSTSNSVGGSQRSPASRQGSPMCSPRNSSFRASASSSPHSLRLKATPRTGVHPPSQTSSPESRDKSAANITAVSSSGPSLSGATTPIPVVGKNSPLRRHAASLLQR